MYRPTPISVLSDQRRPKSTTWSRTSCGTQLPVRAPQVFFLARCARPSTRPGLRLWSAPSSPRTQSVSASPPPGDGDVLSLKGRRSVLEELLLPAVEHRRLQTQFFTQIRNWHFVQKVTPQNGNLLFSVVVPPFFPDMFAPLS